MKKLLAFFCSFMLVISGGNSFCRASSLKSENTAKSSCSDVDDDEVIVIPIKKSKKHSKSSEETVSVSDKRYYGLKNVLSHPFKIIFTGLGWGILGVLASVIIPGIPEAWVVITGAACGAITRAMGLYDEGYNKADTSKNS